MTKIIGSAALTASDPEGENLTTKGDLHGFSDENTRIPISTNDYVLTADSETALGLKWAAAQGLVSPLTANLVWNDSIEANFGTGGTDSKIYHNGTNWHFDPVTGYIIISGNFSMDAGTCLALNRAQATVSSGAITGTSNTMLISAEGGASTDDLDSGNFTAGGVTGCMFTLIAYQDAQTIVVKDQTTGSGQFLGAGDFSLDSYMDTIYFVADAGQTHNQEISRSDNGS